MSADAIAPPGTPPRMLLRPLDLGGLLDRAFRLYRSHFLTLLALVAVLYIPAWIIVELVERVFIGPSADLPPGLGTGNEFMIASGLYLSANVLLPTLRQLLIYPAQGAASTFVEDAYLGEPLSLGGAYRRVLGKLGPLLGIMGVQALILLCTSAPMPLLTLAESASLESSAAVTVICLVALLGLAMALVGTYASVRFALAVPVAMVEDTGAVQSLRRSWSLSKGNWWRTFWLLKVLLGVLSMIVVAGPVLLVEWVAGPLTTGGMIEGTIISMGAQAIVSMLFLPVELLVTALYYFDLRIRQEGLDIETDIARQYQPADVPTIFAHEMDDQWEGGGDEAVEEVGPSPATYSPLTQEEWAQRVKSRGSGTTGSSGSHIRQVPPKFPEHRG